jgi:diacylglycerol kinase (ATP)
MYILIVNPIAGNGRGMKVYENLKLDPLYKSMNCRTYFTEYEGHATTLTAQIAKMYTDKIKAVVVFGGDGSLHEVINGLSKYPSINIGFIPAGSGNDFARGCGLKGKGVELFRQILTNPHWLAYWFGKVTKEHNQKKKETLFANSVGFGFDALVAKKSNKAKYKKWLNKLGLGSVSYLVALFQVLISFKPKKVELILDGKKLDFERAWMVTITNHPYFGGGMKIVPHAQINKHYFYGLVIDGISKWKVLFLFFTVFLGKHTKLKEVHTFTANQIIVSVKGGIDYQIDGNTGHCYTCSINKANQENMVNRF